MVSHDNDDLKNVSAYMVHHVLNPKSKSIDKHNTKKKNKKSKKKDVASVQHKVEALSDHRTSTILQNGKTSKRFLKKNDRKSQKSEANSCPKPCRVPKSPKGTAQKSSEFEQHFQNKSLFQWMISPKSIEDFMMNHWEKKPVHIPNNRSSNEFAVLVSTQVIDQILDSADIQYTKNVDITFYSNGLKELHNLEGRARPHVVWDFYCCGCSVRMLNPQIFVPNIHKLTSELQEYFGCFVGCNAYLTPPNSQGFAPHYDDIEAFILQIEGKKRWRVYKPRTENEVLPRFSSNDFTSDALGEPMMEVLLSPGDVLYLPRGYIHEAMTEKDFHSLHITISAYQCNAWIDLLQKVVPKAMENAWKKDVEFREGLPLDYLHAAGLTRSRKYKKTKTMIEDRLKSLIHKLADHMQIDSAVDQMASKFLYDALPPVLTEEEKSCSVFGDGLRMGEDGRVIGTTEFQFDEELEIALLRKFVCRLVKEVCEEPSRTKKKVEYRLYYTTDNAMEYHAVETSFSIVPKAFVPCVQYLFQSYPNYVTVRELPYDDIEEKINFVSDLWERGIIRTKEPIFKEEK